MRIVIDMQGAQTESRTRGIGRYTLALTQAIARNRGKHEIILALNGSFPDTIEPIRSAFAGLVPQDNIRLWHISGSTQESRAENKLRSDSAELIREAFLASLQADILHITSLVEGYADDAIGSIQRFDQTTPVSVTFYDLIPLLYADHYLNPNPPYKQYYLRKLEQMRCASLLLAISESSRREAIDVLGYPAEQVVNVSSAVDDYFHPLTVDAQQKQALQDKYHVTRPFAMYTGAIDSRKNVEGLIRSYALLPANIRAEHQLLIVSSLQPHERGRLEAVCKENKLAEDEVLLAGFVPDDELLLLYNLCKVFVFPSWHEGFGLPVLEAMACGRAVIGSNASSVPEVIGRDDALFDAKNDHSIADKMAQVLTDDAFRTTLEKHGLEQAKLFSWDISARRSIAAFEAFHAANLNRKIEKTSDTAATTIARKKLAYVSPLPPERTGIANYSAELLPALREHYDIELITDQETCNLPDSIGDLPVRSVAWFDAHGKRFDRIIYQFGNSPFHSHMLGLLQRHPGTVMLHDFFLSGMLAAEELSGRHPGIWAQALYYSHGYPALLQRYDNSAGDGQELAKHRYPCNLEVLQGAQGVIVHSTHSQKLAAEWYGSHAAAAWENIPHARLALTTAGRQAVRLVARQILGIKQESFVVCSFGFIDPTKFSHRLLETWLASPLAAHPHCELVFVGTNHGGDYGKQLAERILNSGYSDRIRIAGWTEKKEYDHYLQAADMGVQLRTMSRGETSGAVLDCMNHGLPTIVNAHGSMADLSELGTWKLADNFSDEELVQALETLWRDKSKRDEMSRQALHIIGTHHAPAYCAKLYAAAIEKFHLRSRTSTTALVEALGNILPATADDEMLMRTAASISQSMPLAPALPQLLVDVSTICRSDLQTGIERVVRAQLSQLLRHPPAGYRIEPVYLSETGGIPHYRYARQYTYGLLSIDSANAHDVPVTIAGGDIFYGADFCPADVIKASNTGIYSHWRLLGVSINFLVHDILPLTHPQFFPNQTDGQHGEWLHCIAGDADRLICISQAVADQVALWLAQDVKRQDHRQNQDASPIQDKLAVLHHGADIAASFPSSGMPEGAIQVLDAIRSSPGFLMVGTIEPRKGHLQAIAAFEQLWQEGATAKLVIVGREGWTSLPRHQRRTIPQTIDKLRGHPELGKRLIWLADISDEYLEKVYAACTCLLFASEGEGFGLPLIEAAQCNRPIIARDIPVFREIAREHAYYFNGSAAEDLANAIRHWLILQTGEGVPLSGAMGWNTWEQNAQKLVTLLRGA